MIRAQPPIPERVPVLTFPTPRGKEDLVFYEVRDSRLPKNKEWCYGDAHPNKKEFPDHELVLVASDGGDAAWQRWYYAAVRERQNLYNWQYSNSPDWPVITQTFFVKRCDLPVNESELLPPPTEFIPDSGFVLTELEVGRAGDDMLESLYVTVTVKREQITSNPKISYVIDPQTNEVRTVIEEKIPATDAASAVSAVDENGQYTEVRAATSRWAIKTTQFMQGLAGGGDGYTQEWTDVINYSWPYVLRDVSYNVFPSPSGGIAKLTTTPRWLRERYDGPCEATITERWTIDEPLPPLLEPMITTGIEFNGGLLQIGIPPCLHPAWYFYDSPGTNHPDFGNYFYREDYPATTLLDWPEEHIASFTVRPAMGGYISRTVKVKRPSGGTVFANIISLAQPTPGATTNSVNLSWSRANPVGTLVRYRVDVNTKADFTTGNFLTGFNNKNVGTATTLTVTGLTPGVTYFVRVKAYITIDSVETVVMSNVQFAAATAVASYSVSVDSAPLLDGGTLDYGAVNLPPAGAPAVKTLTIDNTGNVALTLPNLTLSGADAAFWDVSTPSPTTISVGGSSTVDITFEPNVSRAYVAEATLNFGNASLMAVALQGSAGSPIESFELNASPVTSGATEDFAGGGNPANASPVSNTLTVLNSASATSNLTIFGWNITGSGASAWQASTFFDPIVIAPGGSASVTLDFIPTAAGSYSALFSLTHDGDAADFELNLTGTAAMATIPIGGTSVVFTEPLSSAATTEIFFQAESPSTVTLLPFECSAISVSGADASLFSSNYSSGFTLLPAANLLPDLEVTFAGAPSDGIYSASLEVYHSHPSLANPLTVSLTAYVSSSY